MNLFEAPIDTAWGRFTARFSPHGLAQLQFPPTADPGPTAHGVVERPTSAAPIAAPDPHRAWVALTTAALKEWLKGNGSGRPLPPLAPEPAGSPFQRAVWRALRDIQRGEVVTYGGLARRLGRPRAARAIGQACGANPIPVFIPCHRVLPSGGGLGGFTAGEAWKRRLLALEGVSG